MNTEQWRPIFDAGIFLFEILCGTTPFHGKTRQKTFTNILSKKLVFPTSVPLSLEAKQLISALLAKTPQERLGAKLGANEIKAHPFFAGVKWALIRNAVRRGMFSRDVREIHNLVVSLSLPQ